MDFQIDMVIQMIDEAASSDLAACQASIRSGDSDAAIARSDQALAKLGVALEALRSIPRETQDLGLTPGVF